MAAVIDWNALGRAVEFYKARDYVYVEADWAVPDEVVSITAPHEHWRAGARMALGTLVGSAEQSFLDLDLAGKLPKGKFVAVSPCFRPAEDLDELHQRHFMKIELYDNTSPSAIMFMLADAGACFRELGARKEDLRADNVDGGVDIMLNGIEVGSYGIRRHGDHIWTFGTGLALPRFSQALVAA